MKFRQTPIASAVALALFTTAVLVHAQQADKKEPDKVNDKQAVDTVVITGIRFSLEKSLEAKRNADSHVDVITADVDADGHTHDLFDPRPATHRWAWSIADCSDCR